MIVQYSFPSPEVDEVIGIMEDHSFAFKKEMSNEFDGIRLIEGKNSYLGYEEVLKHLRKLSSETSQWWYCQCDG